MNDTNTKITPKIGMGCTEHLFTDSHACTITKISPSGKTIWYRRDKASIIEGSAQDGSAKYAYKFDGNAIDEKATLRKDGRYRATGTNYLIQLNCRHEYYDPHF